MSNKDRNLINSDGDTLSDRLLFALEALKITQASLARSINVKPQAINFLCKSKTRKSQLTYEIADALGINAEWLANGIGYMKLDDDPQHQLINSQSVVPILPPIELISLFKQKLNYQKNCSSDRMLMTSANVGHNGFAIELTDKSMYPRFSAGTILIFSTEKKPSSNDFVLVYLSKVDELIFRQFEIINGTINLRPLNLSIYKNVSLTDSDLIVGTLIEARWQA